MKAARFDYARAADPAAAIRLLAEARGAAKLIAGGQSLGPMLNLRLARPQILVDISKIPALRRIEDAGAAWRVGSSVTHAQIEDAQGRLPGGAMLCEVAAGIAYRAIRNRGTIGGSLAHADPAADWPLALAALGARVEIHGPEGTRSVPAESMIMAAFTTPLAEDEMIVAVEAPKLSSRARYGYYKFCRKTGEFPEAAAAAVFDPERGVARVFVGATNGAPAALSDLAARVAERGAGALADAAIADAIAGAIPHLDSIERRMQTAAVTRALQKVFRS